MAISSVQGTTKLAIQCEAGDTARWRWQHRRRVCARVRGPNLHGLAEPFAVVDDDALVGEVHRELGDDDARLEEAQLPDL